MSFTPEQIKVGTVFYPSIRENYVMLFRFCILLKSFFILFKTINFQPSYQVSLDNTWHTLVVTPFWGQTRSKVLLDESQIWTQSEQLRFVSLELRFSRSSGWQLVYQIIVTFAHGDQFHFVFMVTSECWCIQEVAWVLVCNFR